ncbi:MAG: hypothetical protein Q8R00_03990 [Candidatus Nanoarchaeia archaeon]|nr:hypothetical protein [Candidatus Nanoarchaeia archaeon]
MRKLTLITSLILLLLIAGCVKPIIDDQTGNGLGDSIEEDKKIDPQLLELLDKKDNVANIKYEYSRPPDDAKVYIYSVRGDKARVDLPRFNVYPKDQPKIDTVYLEFDERIATGYCEYRDICKGIDADQPFEVAIGNYFQKTPYDWLKEIPVDKASIVGSEQIGPRTASVVEYTEGGTLIRVFIEEFYHLPLRVEVKSPLGDDYAHTYKILDMERVKPEEVLHQQR